MLALITLAAAVIRFKCSGAPSPGGTADGVVAPTKAQLRWMQDEIVRPLPAAARTRVHHSVLPCVSLIV